MRSILIFRNSGDGKETGVSDTRILKLEGCTNLRDVGGYATTDGASIMWGRLLRSDCPHRLTEAGWQHLADYGVRAVVDLRRPAEVARISYRPADQTPVRYHNLPIFDDAQYLTVDKPAQDLDQLYTLFLAYCGPAFARALRVMIADGGTPTLVHCAVGKDRTGLTIALALGVAGVDVETIAQDYALSEPLLAPLMAEVKERERQMGGDMQRFEKILLARHDQMLRTWEHLGAQYGGPEAYLNRVGMKDSEIDELRRFLRQP